MIIGETTERFSRELVLIFALKLKRKAALFKFSGRISSLPVLQAVFTTFNFG